MIISIAVVIGFKASISNKIIGFASHMQIQGFSNYESMQEKPLLISDDFIDYLKNRKDLKHIQFTAHKAGVLKTEDQIQGVIFKGVGADFDSNFLYNSLVEGVMPNISEESRTDEVLISSKLSSKMNLKVGDPLRVWFISEQDKNARGRKFIVSGIFDTSLEEFDNAFVIGDIKHVQRLNNWNENQIGKIEVTIENMDDLDDISNSVYKHIPYNMTVTTVKDQYPQIFNWLDLLDMNVAVILSLLIIVASITMISTLLIIIIERTNMVGVLKSLGLKNRSVRKIFLYKASYIIFKGMVWGNIIGLAFYFLQSQFRIIRLDPVNYYVDYVPVTLNVYYLLALNVGTFLVCFLMLIIPSYYITRIVPSKALRYE
ncbi:MAG: ABC transporter permease [Marinilabiliales bacterium]|jgi:lipoprotein-releasing system permease protein|nr:MAG: ABC transporter permease [Marinilabiliales bacterium]